MEEDHQKGAVSSMVEQLVVETAMARMIDLLEST